VLLASSWVPSELLFWVGAHTSSALFPVVAVSKQRCITVYAPFWIGVLIACDWLYSSSDCMHRIVTVPDEYMYRYTPTIYYSAPTSAIGWARIWHVKSILTCSSHLDYVLIRVLVIRRDKKPDKDGFAVLTAYLCQCLQQVKLRLHPPQGRAQRIA